MATIKVTFTLDQATVTRIEQAASCLALPKSQVVREAVAEFSERIRRLSERERLNLLRTFDEVVSRIPKRDVRQVDRELKTIRLARGLGGRWALAKRRTRTETLSARSAEDH